MLIADRPTAPPENDPGRLRAEIAALRAELATARAEVARLEALALEDPVTNLLNRRGFLRELDRALAFARRYGSSAALLLADLDRFKPINDHWGHAAGDAALRHVAGVLRANLRASDSIGRIGGDEFAVLLWQVDDATAQQKADALSRILAATPVVVEGEPLSVEASIGATSLQGSDDVAAVLDRADRAMYARKSERSLTR